MQDFLTFIGHGFCHQIPARTFESGGLFFAVCARDTGIHLGIALAVLWAFALYARARIKPGDMPPAPILVILVLMVVPMAFDGISSYAGWRPTTNTIRFITGLLCGVAIGSLFAPFLMGLRRDADFWLKAYTRRSAEQWSAKDAERRNAETQGYESAERQSTDRRVSLPLAALQLTVPIALGTGFLFTYPLFGVVAPFIEAAAFIAVVSSVNLLALSLSTRLRPTGSGKRWLTILGLSLVLAMGELGLTALLREFVLRTLFGSVVPWL
ncbi:MAG: DUF2085 domain-containing protein [Coriobacteriales bacterium]|jgi:uncharacterized membrane protein|nr:DUF2085 domain-containing protein [Coriobacteriales bacterium]